VCISSRAIRSLGEGWSNHTQILNHLFSLMITDQTIDHQTLIGWVLHQDHVLLRPTFAKPSYFAKATKDTVGGHGKATKDRMKAAKIDPLDMMSCLASFALLYVQPREEAQGSDKGCFRE
jgi:hypothetical protein